jgi:hypothetical protein
MNLLNVVRQLRKQREQAAKEVARLDSAIKALSGATHGKPTGKRWLSAAARERIRQAQIARWKKYHAAKKG